MSSNTAYYTNGYPVVTNNPVAEFLLFQPASIRTFPQTVNSNITPCRPSVQSFNSVQFVRELPPCQPGLRQLRRMQYPLYPSVNTI